MPFDIVNSIPLIKPITYPILLTTLLAAIITYFKFSKADLNRLTPILCAAYVILSLIIVFYINGKNVNHREIGKPEQFGQFGDYIGGILNPILGFITIILLISTLTEQRKANALFQQAERVAANKRDIKDALNSQIRNINSMLDRRSLYCPDELSPRFSYRFAMRKRRFNSRHDANRLVPLKNSLIRVMRAKQEYNSSDQADFINSARNNLETIQRSQILSICEELRSSFKVIRRGYLDLFKLEGTEFLLETAFGEYVSLLLEFRSLNIISKRELDQYTKEAHLQLALGYKELDKKE